MESIKLKIQGVKIDNADNYTSSEVYQVKETFRISADNRGESLLDTKIYEIEVSDGELIEFQYEDDTTWICDQETLNDLFPEIKIINRSASFAIPTELVESSAEQRGGFVKKILLKLVKILVKNGIEKEIKELAEDFDKKSVDGKSGLFHLTRDFVLKDLNTVPIKDKPCLLFIHGTATNLEGSFKLLKGTPEWYEIYQTYDGNILGFQHETLSKSPLTNAKELIEALPNGINLDLVTGSRGGILGDILTLYSDSNNRNKGFNQEQLNYFKKEKRTDDLDDIKAISKELSSKSFSINKFVRVGCPAAGTSLASKRLSIFLNVLTNVAGLVTGGTANPVYLSLKALLTTVVATKNNQNVLPGLEAQRPESPFIKVLNHPGAHQTNEKLVVISANALPKFNLRGLLIIVARSVFYGKNDLVVDTKSMYQGVRRGGKILYHFEQDVDIHHLDYYRNSDTRAKVLSALQPVIDESLFKSYKQDEIPDTDRNALITLFGGPGGILQKDKISGKKPILILLPGIMGSILSNGDDMVWVDFTGMVRGKLNLLSIDNHNIKVPGIVKSSYGKFVNEFSEKYDILTYGFDWRKSLEETAKSFNNKIVELLRNNQEIKIVAHSMGGVLFRDFIINHPDTWQKLNNSKKFKVLFLGTPFKGSYRIPAVLTGKDKIIKQLATIDITQNKAELLTTFVRFRGIHNLLPLELDSKNDFADKSVWGKLKESANEGDFPIPSDEDLEEFKRYRQKVLNTIKSIDYTNMIYVAGKGKTTFDGYSINSYNGKSELEFTPTPRGDESVTYDSGIPEKIKALENVYYVNVTHGSLADDKKLYKGFQQILDTGRTNEFEKNEINNSIRGEDLNDTTIALSEEVFDNTPDNVEKVLLGLTLGDADYVSPITIEASVSKGDLLYASYPVFAGHFSNDGILNAEKSIDNYLDNTLSKRLQLGLYPEKINENKIFLNDKPGSPFKGAIILGLGQVGEFSYSALSSSYEFAVLNYLLYIKSLNTVNSVGISSLIIGSGYGGLSLETSLSAILEGINNANEKMRAVYPKDGVTVNHVEFVERVEDKAINCFQTLVRLERNNSSFLPLQIKEKKIKALVGGFQRRITFDNENGDWWNVITINKDLREGVEGMSFSYSTKGAKQDKRSVFVGSSVIDDLVKTISQDNQLSNKIAKALFEQLIPNEFKEDLHKKQNILWILDEKTAEYPWELLQAALHEKAKPLAVNGGMIRRLQTQNAFFKNELVTSNTAIVIGDPLLANTGFRQLDGAKLEGELVSKIFINQGITTTQFIRDSASQILPSLFIGGYKYMHLAGHGKFTKNDTHNSGMLIGNSILSPAHINQIKPAPEFAFINCCELGEVNSSSQQTSYDSFRLAANIGTQLIQNGVKAVIVAGWAVGDKPALQFANSFYKYMFAGYTFGDSVRKCREDLFRDFGYENNTWGAYQCYGDQFYTFVEKTKWQEHEDDYATSEQIENDLFNFSNDLERGNQKYENNIARLSKFLEKIDKSGIDSPVIDEHISTIYSELGDYGLAIKNLEKLMANENASYTVKALEKYCNLRTKKIALDFKANPQTTDLDSRFMKVIADLETLQLISQTAERLNLLGSAYKRRAYILDVKADKRKYYKLSLSYYEKALEFTGNKYKVYSHCNVLTLHHLLSKTQLSNADKTTINDYLLSLNNDSNVIDYWDLSKRANLFLLKFIFNYGATFSQVEQEYKNLWDYAGSRDKKLAEIEHLEIVRDVMGLKNIPPADIDNLIQTLLTKI